MNRIFKWVIVASRLMVLTTVFCGANVLTSCTSNNNDNPTAMIQGDGQGGESRLHQSLYGSSLEHGWRAMLVFISSNRRLRNEDVPILTHPLA